MRTALSDGARRPFADIRTRDSGSGLAAVLGTDKEELKFTVSGSFRLRGSELYLPDSRWAPFFLVGFHTAPILLHVTASLLSAT